MKRILLGVLVLVIVLSATSCRRPYKKEIFAEVAPNETAFLISLEGDSEGNQAQLDSVAFLEKKKVAAKRITIAQRFHQTGRKTWSGKWIPSQQVLLVDRAPVSREWTADSNRGTSAGNEGFTVESADSIEFTIGGTCTAQILEENTAKFLYYYAGRSLSEIMDTNIRNSILTGLSEGFAEFDLKDGRSEKATIFKEVVKNVTEMYSDKGITITDGGISGGMTYTNQSIQTAIDKEFESALLANVRKNEATAQAEVNKMSIDMATAEKRQAEIWNLAAAAQTRKTQLKIELMKAQADLARAEGWNGSLPSQILPADSPLLLGISN